MWTGGLVKTNITQLGARAIEVPVEPCDKSMRRLACDWGYTDAKFKQEKHYRMEPAPQVEASQQIAAPLCIEFLNRRIKQNQHFPFKIP